ncbi:MAG: hypothetical protein ABIQ95_02205 [Bdellovibrionia bacterium]
MASAVTNLLFFLAALSALTTIPAVRFNEKVNFFPEPDSFQEENQSLTLAKGIDACSN